MDSSDISHLFVNYENGKIPDSFEERYRELTGKFPPVGKFVTIERQVQVIRQLKSAQGDGLIGLTRGGLTLVAMNSRRRGDAYGK